MSDPYSFKISLLADSDLLMPMAAVFCVWVSCYSWQLALRWILALGLAVILVILSKLSWAAWHWEIPFVRVRMVSGHMVLAFAIWPPVLDLILGTLNYRLRNVGRYLGFAICCVVGVSRLFGAHLVSEVVIGALLGLLIERRFASKFRAIDSSLKSCLTISFVLIAVFFVRYGHVSGADHFSQNYQRTIFYFKQLSQID